MLDNFQFLHHSKPEFDCVIILYIVFISDNKNFAIFFIIGDLNTGIVVNLALVYILERS